MATGDRPKVLCMVDFRLAPEALDYLRRHTEVECQPPSRERLLDTIGDYDAFWGHKDLRVDKEVLDRAARLTVVCTATTGTDHIDKQELARRGIKLLSITRDYGLLKTLTATAECAWMLLLACARHLRGAMAAVLDGQWNTEDFVGRQFCEQTLGVLGLGRLGSMMCRTGRGFDMRVLGCDRAPKRPAGVELVDFDTLLRESDFLSIHVHMEPENYHLFNDLTFGLMKHGAILVNTSRGDIVDEAALIRSLKSGRLAAYGTDVLHDEWRVDMRQSPLVQYAMEHDNVVIVPHIGGCTLRSIVDARVFTAKKLVHYLQTGQELTMDG